jgi:hypothetical protein
MMLVLKKGLNLSTDRLLACLLSGVQLEQPKSSERLLYAKNPYFL